jgi:serine/threonine-protein kinase
MAEIFLARRPGPAGAELVVIKRLLPEDAEDPVILRMFEDEARLALRLGHPSIVRALGLGMLEERHALVLEFLEGQTLHMVMRRAAEYDRQLPVEALVPLFADVAEALHYAHELADEAGRPLNVVHRDVSPHNLFVTTAGTVKLLDFGIAKTAVQENRTRTGLLKGKVAYMAPEQALGARVDRRADLWSLGVSLWEALAGTRLFKADNEAASLRLTLSGPIAKPSSVRAEIPSEIDRIVLRALQREPAQRYASAAIMAEELRAWARRQRVPMIAPARGIMTELFERDTAEQRARISGLLIQPENVPISSTVPVLAKLPPADTAGATHVSTVTEFLGQLEERQRRARRRTRALVALVATAVLGLGYALFTHGGEHADAPAPIAPLPVAQAGSTPPDTVTVRPAAREEAPTAAAAPSIVPTSRPAAPNGSEAPRHRVAEAVRDVPATDDALSPVLPAPVEHSPPLEPAAEPKRSARTAASAEHADAEFGFLTLDSTPWSQVSADGTPLGQTPLVRAKLPAGPHTLVLTNSERGLSSTYQITIEAGKTSVRRVGLD